MDVPLYICCICFGQGILMAQSEAVVQNHGKTIAHYQVSGHQTAIMGNSLFL